MFSSRLVQWWLGTILNCDKKCIYCSYGVFYMVLANDCSHENIMVI